MGETRRKLSPVEKKHFPMVLHGTGRELRGLQELQGFARMQDGLQGILQGSCEGREAAARVSNAADGS